LHAYRANRPQGIGPGGGTWRDGLTHRRAGSPGIYLAGPTVFEPEPETRFSEMKAICARHGLEGVSPLDNQIGLEGLAPGRTLLRRIVSADIALMQRLDGGVFCLDGFRGAPEMDAGTAFEIGYMAALGKPMAGWTSDPRQYPLKVQHYFERGMGAALVPAQAGAKGGTSGLQRDPHGMLVHSEGCVQNAMTEIGIELNGGAVFADSDWTVAFDAAVALLARTFAARPTP
jgi:nucleoside 2-deoxyribosyltransferase